MRSAYVTPAAYMVLKRGDGKILLARRANTGYADGMYQPPAGHIEEREAPSIAAIRETKEEVGVTVRPEDVHLAHLAYPLDSVPGTQYADFFFVTEKWEGEPYNAEPEKCDDLIWVSMDELPETTVPYVRVALDAIARGDFYSEHEPTLI